MLEFIRVSLGEGEEPGCVRCRPRSRAREYLPAARVTESVAAACATWPGGAGPNVELAGPEPLGHPELPAVVAGALGAGVRRLRLVTDAAAFAAGANAAGAASAGVLHIRFVLLGGTPGLHDALIGTPGAFDATRSGIEAFVSAARAQERPIHVSALVPVCRHTVRDLPAAVGAATEAGADEVILRAEDGGMDLVTGIPWISSACATGVVNGVWVQVEGVPVCLMAGDELHVADVVRERRGRHGPGCADCVVRDVCPGGPADGSADVLAALRPPPDASRVAERIRKARGGVPA